MFDTAKSEGNSAALIIYPNGGHSQIPAWTHWAVSCWGLGETCSQPCEASFRTCVNSNGFDTCNSSLKAGGLAQCTKKCGMTAGMLRLVSADKPTIAFTNTSS